METGRKIPQHIAIILDGNGRWAKAKGMPRNYGHTAGAKNVETVCQAAHDLGVKYVTMYAFSTENWNRPEGEVEALMKLLESYLKNCIKTADKNNMRVRVIGDTTRLSERFQERIRELEAASAKNNRLHASRSDYLLCFTVFNRKTAIFNGTTGCTLCRMSCCRKLKIAVLFISILYPCPEVLKKPCRIRHFHNLMNGSHD